VDGPAEVLYGMTMVSVFVYVIGPSASTHCTFAVIAVVPNVTC
jgi:hypothetical protein